jgi:PAS domain S-box-containing protein
VSEGHSGANGTDTDTRGELHLRLFIDTTVDYAIFLLDTTGNVASWNRGAARLKGYAAEEIIGRHFSTFYTPEDLERDHPAHELEIALREGRYEEEGWRVRKDGSRFWASVVITTIRSPEGEHLGFGKVTRDLTSRRLAEERLRIQADELRRVNSQLDQFRRLVSAVRDYAIFMLDPDGRIVTWNDGARHIKGYEAGEAIGRHFSMFYTADARERDHPARELEIAAAEGRYEEEGWRLRKDGSRFWADVLITAVRGDDGELLGFAKVTRDLSERREAEEALRLSRLQLEEANAELDRFAVVAAHDLNEPLRTISGFAELLHTRHGDELSERAALLVTEMGASAERMQRLIDDLLTFARSGELPRPPQRVALRQAAERAVADLRAMVRDRDAVVTVDVPGEAAVHGDPADVEMVLRNLLSNALKFAAEDEPRVEVAAAPDPGGWRIEVADNGIGIAADQRERIFEAFQRLHSSAEYPGTGLGLAICQRIVERNAGHLGVESEPGRGSRFWVVLPAA